MKTRSPLTEQTIAKAGFTFKGIVLCFVYIHFVFFDLFKRT